MSGMEWVMVATVVAIVGVCYGSMRVLAKQEHAYEQKRMKREERLARMSFKNGRLFR